MDSGNTASQRLLLYVEDNPANVQLMEAIIERVPELRMITARTAEEGLDMATDSNPDIILLDIALPGMDGYEALERLRADRQFSNTPVLALSANAMPDDIAKGEAASFAHYLTKPLIVEDFVGVLRDIHSQLS